MVVTNLDFFDFLRTSGAQEQAQSNLFGGETSQTMGQTKIAYENSCAKFKRFNNYYLTILYTRMKQQIETHLRMLAFMTSIYKKQKTNLLSLKTEILRSKTREADDLLISLGNV